MVHRNETQGRILRGSLMILGLIIVYLVPIPILVFKAMLTGPLLYDLAHIIPKLPRFETESPYLFLQERKVIQVFFELTIYGLIGTEFITMYYSNPELITLGFYIAMIVSLSDALQYLFGKKYGRNHLGWPSPNKTYEGYFGAILAAMIGGFLLGWRNSSIAVIAGVFGDLFESRCKRLLKIEETSNLLKEHGGWLDRVDSIYLAMIVMYPVICYSF